MFLTGNPLRSAYRVTARDGRMVWFHCQAKMVRREDGSPWLIHGAAFDITDVKQAQQALQDERNVVSAILDTVGALVVVLDPEGRIVRFNRACERTTGYEFEEVQGRDVSDVFRVPEQLAHFETIVEQARMALGRRDYEAQLQTKSGGQRTIAWSSTALRVAGGKPRIHHRHGNRRHRTQAPRTRHTGDQRPRAAADRPGSSRRAGPAPHRHRVHEQGAAATPRGAVAAGISRGVEDREAGERSHRTRRASWRGAWFPWCPTRPG